MEYHNKMLCVTRDELIGGKNPIMKEGTLNASVYYKRIVPVVRGGGEGGYALYSFDSMPDKYKAKFVAKYGDPEKVLREREMKAHVKYDSKARTWYEEFEYLKNGEKTTLSPELIDEYVTNASVLNELIKMKNERRAMMASLNAKAKDVWKVVLENSERLREHYNHTLPVSESRLKLKMKDYEKRGYESLISGKIGNINTTKVTEDGVKVLISLRRSQTPRYSIDQIFEKYNEIAVINDWKTLRSPDSLKALLGRKDIEPLWWDAVHGEQSARQRYGRKQKTVMPMRRDSLWYGDGTKLNLYYRDEKGKVCTTGVYEVVDAMSEVLLGYCISDTEDYEAQYRAFRMAIERSGHKPYEIVHDNQGGHQKLKASPSPSKRRGARTHGGNGGTEQGFLDKICHIHRPTMPYNGESKTIESIFGRFQSQVLARYYNFTGQNVTAKKLDSRPNMEMIAANKENLPTYRELCEIYAECRKEWNAMAHPKLDGVRIELYEKSVNEDTPEVGKYEMEDMFWCMSSKPITFTDSGIKMTLKGQTYQWEVFDENGLPDRAWRMKHTWEKFYIQYDPADMTSVNLYSIDLSGNRRRDRVAKPYFEIPRAMQDQTAEQKAWIHADLERGKQDRIDRVVAGRKIAIGHGTDPEQNGLNYPKLKGLTKEQQEQVYERLESIEKGHKKDMAEVRSLSQPIEKAKKAEEVELGRYTKMWSNEDWSDYIEVDKRVMAGKL